METVSKARTFYKTLFTLSQERSLYATVLAQEAAAALSASRAKSGPTSRVATTTPTPESYSAVTGIPSAWWPTALCEEGGRNDPYAGYFGILEWQGFGGYATAGSAPLSVQLAWEAAHGQGPPDAPGECHGY
jgi:hypothetical protein